ncbi:tectonin domain-containing protein [Candidatus Riflebacteria bacterium]
MKEPANPQNAAGEWKKLPGKGLDLGVNANGVACMVGKDKPVYKWSGNSWQRTKRCPKKVKRIDVDPLGRPWVVASNKYVYILERDNNWYKMGKTKAIDIGCGGPGSGVVCIIGNNKKTY